MSETTESSRLANLMCELESQTNSKLALSCAEWLLDMDEEERDETMDQLESELEEEGS